MQANKRIKAIKKVYAPTFACSISPEDKKLRTNIFNYYIDSVFLLNESNNIKNKPLPINDTFVIYAILISGNYLYIGQSKNLKKRLKYHHVWSFCYQYSQLFYVEVDSNILANFNILQIEAAFIDRYNANLNNKSTQEKKNICSFNK